MSDLVAFDVVIPEANVANCPHTLIAELEALLASEVSIVENWSSPDRFRLQLVGVAPAPVVAVLQALVDGDPIGPLLDAARSSE